MQPQHATNMRMDSRSETVAGAQVILWEDVESDALLWQIVRNADGSYRISPKKNLGLSLCVENPSSGNNAKVKLATTSASADNQKWYFESIEYGNGGSYRSVSGVIPNCIGYALFQANKINMYFYPWQTSHMTEDYSDDFEDKINEYAQSCRRIKSYAAPIASDEYRVAVRCPRGDIYNYHMIYQLSNGDWAGKDGEGWSEQFNAGNPDHSPEMWSDNRYSESCGTIYFAVRRSS